MKLDEVARLDELSFVNKGITTYLHAKGFKKLGSGVDVTAYLAPTGHVLKIFGYDDEEDDDYDHGQQVQKKWTPKNLSRSQNMFIQYAQFCANNSKNPYLPRFGKGRGGKVWAPFVFKNKTYLQIWQERLYPAKIKGTFLAAMADGIDNGQAMEDFLSEVEEYGWKKRMTIAFPSDAAFALCWHTLEKLNRIADDHNFMWDMHNENFMCRADGTPVIVDPWH